jgi:hydroxyethylthiazole kinase-like uncharacterized protein yjeF
MRGPPSLIRVVTSAEAGARDRAAIDGGIPSRALMQRAGAASAAEIALRFRDRLRAGALVYAGPGNNGGDAWVVARALAASGVAVRVCEPVPAATDDARAERALALDQVELVDGSQAADAFRGEGVVVDGLLGTGSAGAPRGGIAVGMLGLRAARDRGAGIIALDLPTGVDASTGVVHRPVRAHLTLTYGTIKRGHLLARAACGRIAVLDIGLGAFADDAHELPRVVSGAWAAEQVPAFAADAHKGARRKLAIVGGGPGMSGAAILAARAAWRSGIGMVKLVVSPDSLAAVREAEPQSLTVAWPENERDAVAIAQWADVLAVGPGLGTGGAARALVERILGAHEGPAVLDADALNIFKGDVNALAALVHRRVAVLTPHPVEFARITGEPVDDVLARRFEVGLPLAKHTRAVVLLKGQPTVLTAPSGERLVAASGTPLLAAAGSGDLLTGMVATLLAQLPDPLIAAACAAYVHGRAAWLAQQQRPAIRGLSLDDVIAALPRAWSLSPAPSRSPVLLELPDLVPG